MLSMSLRVCNRCGLEAKSETELELFSKCKTAKYGRSNLCKTCAGDLNKEWVRKHPDYMKRYRVEYHEKNSGYYQGWRAKNLEHLEEYEAERLKHTLSFRGKLIRLVPVLRTNICSMCDKSYPGELSQQTSLHHVIYDEGDPVANTVELCNSCHGKLHNGATTIQKR